MTAARRAHVEGEETLRGPVVLATFGASPAMRRESTQTLMITYMSMMITDDNMGGMLSDTSDTTSEDETCIFCLIANDQDKDTEIIKKNKELVCFRDIYPAAPHHYLVVPIEHIHSCLSLHGGHVGLVERMAEMGKSVLYDQGITDVKDMRLGFHRPPKTSVDHLHLHVIAPTSQISEYLSYKFIPGTERFVTEEHLRKCLKDEASPVISCLKSCFNSNDDSLIQIL